MSVAQLPSAQREIWARSPNEQSSGSNSDSASLSPSRKEALGHTLKGLKELKTGADDLLKAKNALQKGGALNKVLAPYFGIKSATNISVGVVRVICSILAQVVDEDTRQQLLDAADFMDEIEDFAIEAMSDEQLSAADDALGKFIDALGHPILSDPKFSAERDKALQRAKDAQAKVRAEQQRRDVDKMLDKIDRIARERPTRESMRDDAGAIHEHFGDTRDTAVA